MDDVEEIGRIPLWMARMAVGAFFGGIVLLLVPILNLLASILLVFSIALAMMGLVAGLLCWRARSGRAAVLTTGILLTVMGSVYAFVSSIFSD